MKYAVLACILCGAGASASAEEPAIPRSPVEVHMRMDDSGRLEAIVRGVPIVIEVDQLALYSAADPGRSARLMRTGLYANGDERVALAILYPGHHRWIGTDDVETIRGQLRDVAAAFDHVEIASRVTPGSQFTLITYGDGARTHLPWSPMSELRSAAFGTPRDYPRQEGADLIAGLEEALTQLERSGAPCKTLLVLGDDDSDTPVDELGAMVRRARHANIGVFAIATKGSVAGGGAYGVLGGQNAWVINAAEGLPKVLDDAVIRAFSSHWYASFDVSALNLYGPQDLVLSIDGQEANPVYMTFPPAPPPPWWDSGLRQIGLGALLVGLIALAVRARFRARRAR